MADTPFANVDYYRLNPKDKATLPQPFFSGEAAHRSKAEFSNNVITYNSYSGVDIVAEMLVPCEPKPLILGDLATLSYSIHRENKPVRLIGRTNVAGWLRGNRTIAGSLIFTNFEKYTFYRLKKFQKSVANGYYPLADMLPPFDIIVSFANEYGQFSKLKIFGVNIIDEGSTMSVDDLVTESTFTYMARGIQPMISYDPTQLVENSGTTISFGNS